VAQGFQPFLQPMTADSSSSNPGLSPAVGLPEIILKNELVEPAALEAAIGRLRSDPAFQDEGGPNFDPAAFRRELLEILCRQQLLTPFQARELFKGHTKFKLRQYRILDELGKGGMGQVFKAEHELMGRIVAIKVLPRKKSNDATEAAFRREIRMLGRLDHDHLVRALDAGYDGRVFFLVTEMVQGLDLGRQVKKFGPLDEVAAASVIAQVTRALGYAHSQHVVHRDVKPGNIVVSDRGIAKVLDLGLAGSALESEEMRLNRVVGTMDYIAPEQLDRPDDVDARADIYSLGCTLYYLLTGRPPFPGGTPKEKAHRHRHGTADPVRKFSPGISAAFCAVVDGMMEKHPEHRPQTMSAVLDQLQSWIPEFPVPLPIGDGVDAVRGESRSSGNLAATGAVGDPNAVFIGQAIENNDAVDEGWLLNEAEDLKDAGEQPLALERVNEGSLDQARGVWGRRLVLAVGLGIAAFLLLLLIRTLGTPKNGSKISVPTAFVFAALLSGVTVAMQWVLSILAARRHEG
jgi:serine/threonine protein kinase